MSSLAAPTTPTSARAGFKSVPVSTNHILPRDTVTYTMKLLIVKKSKRRGPVLLQLQPIYAVQDRRGLTAGGHGRSKGHATCGACIDEDTDSAAATHTSPLLHARELEAKTKDDDHVA